MMWNQKTFLVPASKDRTGNRERKTLSECRRHTDVASIEGFHDSCGLVKVVPRILAHSYALTIEAVVRRSTRRAKVH